MLKPNLKLLMAIREAGLRQADFARIVRDHPSLVSRVVNGRVNLDPIEQARYARALRRRPEDLFEDSSKPEGDER